METTRRWIGYDTFKLIVALILLLLLLAFMLQPPASAPGQAYLPVVQVATKPPAAPTDTAVPPTAAVASPPTPTLAPTSTAAPTGAPTAVPTAAPTAAPTDTPQAALTPQPTPTTASAVECKPPSASRLVVGKNAMTLGDLNLRSEPKIAENVLMVNPSGTTVKVLDGPVCVPYLDGAYLWWQVETSSGKTGYSAENFYNGLGYYLKPLP
jgi:type IV secretory pathway VirB10-like protein